MAKASASGSATMPTTTPAIRSRSSRSREYPSRKQTIDLGTNIRPARNCIERRTIQAQPTDAERERQQRDDQAELEAVGARVRRNRLRNRVRDLGHAAVAVDDEADAEARQRGDVGGRKLRVNRVKE